ncbi:MAG: hypothetical protein SFW36_12410 [Leptolyngbyaceae cyanobacterium bins.59]|nr:hypothetical protein [Leptolyngbyaceae cyanobacterium bins.59]
MSDGFDLSAQPKVQQALFEIKAAQEARQAAVLMAYEQQQHIKRQASEARQVARMQQFLDSGDPILMAEAIAWAAVNPGVLDMSRTARSSPSEDSIAQTMYFNKIEHLNDSVKRPESCLSQQPQPIGSSIDRETVASSRLGSGSRLAKVVEST